MYFQTHLNNGFFLNAWINNIISQKCSGPSAVTLSPILNCFIIYVFSEQKVSCCSLSLSVAPRLLFSLLPFQFSPFLLVLSQVPPSFISSFCLSQPSVYFLLYLSLSHSSCLSQTSLKHWRASTLLCITGVSTLLLLLLLLPLLLLLEGGEGTTASWLAEAIRTGAVMNGLPPIASSMASYHLQDVVLIPGGTFQSLQNRTA